MRQIRIVHNIPGRTRLRLDDAPVEVIDLIASTINALPGVKTVNSNSRTGSILFTHTNTDHLLLRVHLVLSTLGMKLVDKDQREITIPSGVDSFLLFRGKQVTVSPPSTTNKVSPDPWLQLSRLASTLLADALGFLLLGELVTPIKFVLFPFRLAALKPNDWLGKAFLVGDLLIPWPGASD